MITDDVLAACGRELRKRADAMTKVRFLGAVPLQFTFREISGDFPRGHLQKLLKERGLDPGGQAIYQIDIENAEARTQVLRDFGRRPRDFNIAQDNTGRNSLTLYLGSSHKIAGRLREHLQQASTKTYAMHLKRWLQPSGHMLTVRVQAPRQRIDARLLQDIEDTLWDQAQPLFGKRGGR